MSNIAISIIVPVYNTEKYLKKCLESLRKQTLSNIEIILIDDGSTDSSPAICDAYFNDERFIVIHNKNQGPSASRNLGINLAKGEYCMFVDSDDWLENDACEIMYTYAKKNDSDLIIGGHVNEATSKNTERYIFKENIVFDGEKYAKEILQPTLGLINENIKNPANLDRLTPVWSRLYRTNIIKLNDIKFIDLTIIPSECMQFNFEFVVHAKRAAFLHEKVYHYRRNTINSVTKPYRNDLWSKWAWWIKYEEKFLKTIKADELLWKAYYSRICCSIIPLGGNAIKLNSLKKIKEECMNFLKQEAYIKAFREIDYSQCPIYWKIFFSSAKNKNIFLFIFLTKCMRILLRRRKS